MRLNGNGALLLSARLDFILSTDVFLTESESRFVQGMQVKLAENPSSISKREFAQIDAIMLKDASGKVHKVTGANSEFARGLSLYGFANANKGKGTKPNLMSNAAVLTGASTGKASGVTEFDPFADIGKRVRPLGKGPRSKRLKGKLACNPALRGVAPKA